MLILRGREGSIFKKLEKNCVGTQCKASRAQGSVLGYATDPRWSFSLVLSPLISAGVGHKE